MSFDTPNPPYTSNDPHATYLNASCFEFLLIELVPMAYRMAAEMAEREEQWMHGGSSSEKKAVNTGDGAGGSVTGASSVTGHGALSGAGTGGVAGGADEEETKEAVFYRLETLGYRVGLGLVERFSRDKPRFNDTLDVIKFICKDLWTIIFRKQIDNLKTNHRGIYVLTDNAFRPLSRVSTANSNEGAVARAQPFLWFPCGILRGALAGMGISANVQAESSALPGATFQIKTNNQRVP